MATASLPPAIAACAATLLAAGYDQETAAQLAPTNIGSFAAALLEAGYSQDENIEIVLSAPMEVVNQGAGGAAAYVELRKYCVCAKAPEKAMGFYRRGVSAKEAGTELLRAWAAAADALVTDNHPPAASDPVAFEALTIWNKRWGKA